MPLVMPGRIDVFVPGKPAPQGSKRYLGRSGGKGITVESSKAVAPWRADIREAMLAELECRDDLQAPIAGAVSVCLNFVMPRPASTPKRRTPPAIKRPDIDKLCRAVLDAIGSAGVYRDDSQVISLSAYKRLAQVGETSGVEIRIEQEDGSYAGHAAYDWDHPAVADGPARVRVREGVRALADAGLLRAEAVPDVE